MDMTQEEIKEYNERSRKEFEMSGMDVSLGLVVPLVLFVGGVLTPFFTDDILVWMMSLVPFYVFLFVVITFFRGCVSRNVLGVSTLTTFLGFLLFVVSILFGRFNGSLGSSVGIMEINSFVSIPVVVVLSFTNRMGNCIPWPYYYFMGQTIED